MTSLRKRDLALGLLGTFGGILLFMESLGMMFPSKTFPLGVSGCIIVLSLLILGRALLFPTAYTDKSAQEMASRNTILMMVAAAVYVALINILGFYASSFLCIITMSFLNSHDGTTLRSFGMTILSGLIFLGVVYLIFSYFLQSTIPTGMFM